MDCFIYISNIDFYVQVSNSEFFDTINEFANNGWIMKTEFNYVDEELNIDFFAEQNHIKIEIGHICSHTY